VSCVFSVILAIVYLFYSNRMLALLVGYLLRLSWWDEGSDRSWVSLGTSCLFMTCGNLGDSVHGRIVPGVTSGRTGYDQRFEVSFKQPVV
jgi:hypothetical protein